MNGSSKQQTAEAPPDTRLDPLQEALRASLPVAATPRPAVVGNERPGGLLGWVFESGEARRHRNVEEVIRDVTTEVVLADNMMGVIANDLLAGAMETERGFQETLLQYRDCELAMATAPGYVQMSRSIYSTSMSDINQAGARHITRKIDNR